MKDIHLLLRDIDSTGGKQIENVYRIKLLDVEAIVYTNPNIGSLFVNDNKNYAIVTNLSNQREFDERIEKKARKNRPKSDKIVVTTKLIIRKRTENPMEEQIIPIFCDVDDFCSEYEKYCKTHLLMDESHKVPKSSMSQSEIMTIIIYFHLSNHRTFSRTLFECGII